MERICVWSQPKALGGPVELRQKDRHCQDCGAEVSDAREEILECR